VPQPPLPDSVGWLYLDVPETGVETTVSFVNGRVTVARERPYDASARQVVRHDWAQELMLNHVARLEREFPDPGLTARPAWKRLTSQEVLEFALTARAYPAGPGRIGRCARRFGDLDVIVSLFEVTAPDQIRALVPNGYIAELMALVDGFGITPGKLDLAHWIIGRASTDDTVAHLAFLPSARDITALMPWDLLSPDEQQGGSKIS
jgi:hypothetical protein